jgi:putative membrane protein
MSSAYLWGKALHIVFVASWFAGLFYLPRFFVNLTAVRSDSHAERERLLLMARRLYRFSNVLILIALLSGLWLWLGFEAWHGFRHKWLDLKMLLVIAVVGYQHACLGMLRQFERCSNRRTERWYRVFNEASIGLFTAIVILVVVKPI